ncbi:MAG: DUF2202 domain-containing protein [Gammaproteobacteria bacterium]|nr:DUF2202 domain-containing protein [Gammaproteobacteria bacterium]
MLIRITIAIFASALLGLFSINNSLAGAGPGNGPGPGDGPVIAPLPGIEEADLQYMREEEKLARDSYAVFAEEYTSRLFFNISRSEQRHMDALKRMLDKYGVTDPVDLKPTPGEFVNNTLKILYDDLVSEGMGSYMAALHVGAEIEEIDIIDLELVIANTSPDYGDIIKTYEILLCGARNHLRAFVRNYELDGEIYFAVWLSDEYLAAVVNAPMERSCGDDNGAAQKKRKGR